MTSRKKGHAHLEIRRTTAPRFARPCHASNVTNASSFTPTQTFALSSPIFSTVLTGAVLLYACVDNHWEDREHELIDMGAHHNPMGGKGVQNSQL